MSHEFDDVRSDTDCDEFGDDKVSEEASYICDNCGEEIVVPLDYSEGLRQEYVEDCPVCCNPNEIVVEYDEFGVANIWSRKR